MKKLTNKAVLDKIGDNSKNNHVFISNSEHEKRNKVISDFSDLILENINSIMEANERDLINARKNLVKDSYLDRLKLDEKRIILMAEGLKNVENLPDPLNKTLASWKRPNGLKISRISTPIGVLGVIYESRPNVTADASSLAIKSGNSVILRCGSDSFNSCQTIVKLIRKSLSINDLPEDIVQIVPTKDRNAVTYMLKMVSSIDVIIPRGGKSLVEKIQSEARIPVFSHLEGICHTYVEKEADLEKAVSIVANAKMRRTGICGATETLIIDKEVSANYLPPIVKNLEKLGCYLVGDEYSRSLCSNIGVATVKDWTTEYLAPQLSIKVVEGIEEAIHHITKYGSQHTDSIITENEKTANFFTTHVDSAIVMVNASTQFADGGEFGLGAEIGISTGRLHARGPVGAEQLTSFKYVVHGSGQIRS